MQKNQPKNTITSFLFVVLRGFLRQMLLIWLLILSPFYITAQAEPLIMKAFDMPLPETAIVDEAGYDVRLDAYKGKPLIVNFWATWCAPCIHELPALDRAAQILAGDMQLLLVSVDRGGAEQAAKFLSDRDITTPHSAYDARSEWARSLGIRGLPSTLILSADQKRVWLVSGPAEWDTEEVLSQLRVQLSEAQ